MWVIAYAMPLFEDRCSFPREPVSACGVRLLTMWRVKAGSTYHRDVNRSRHDSQARIQQAGQNLVVVRTDAGEGMLVARGHRHLLTKGSLLLFDFPSMEKYQTVGAKWHFWWVELVAIESPHLPLHQVFEVPAVRRESARCEEVFDLLHAERSEQRHLASATWQHLFFDWLARTEKRAHHAKHTDLAVERVVEAIKRNPQMKWSLDEMAAVSGMSCTSLRTAFHQILGKSPGQVRMQMKLAHAYEHLRRGDRNVTEVAEALGFCDPFYFSKMFKLEFSIPPSKVRHHPR
jgi:AraC-like DNA-binding protein